MVAALMGRSEPPKAFEMTRRILGADCVRKIVWRSVASWKTTPVAFYWNWSAFVTIETEWKSVPGGHGEYLRMVQEAGWLARRAGAWFPRCQPIGSLSAS